MPKDGGPVSGDYLAKLDTVAQHLAETERSVLSGCYHQAVRTFQQLKLWNDMIFVDVPQHRRLVCSQCGGPDVKVMPR
jgi:hypothetical protein